MTKDKSSLSIWYIHPYSGGPGIGHFYKPYDLASAWTQAGHRPAIITSAFHHLLAHNTPLPPQLEKNGIRYYSLATNRYKSNGLARIFNMLSFSRQLLRLAHTLPKGLQQPDVIVASSPHPFYIWSAAKLADTFAAKLVFEIRDIWPLSLIELAGLSNWHPLTITTAAAEQYALSRADLIASVLPRIKPYLEYRGFSHKPLVWVPNSPSSTNEQPMECSKTRHAIGLLQEWKREGKTSLIYVGAMGPPNGLMELMDALETPRAKDIREKFAVMILGKGILEKAIAERAARSPSRIAVLGSVPKANVPEILRHADVGYCGITHKPGLYKYGVSLNKIFDYLSAAIPCVLPIEPCGDPISESGAGICQQANTPAELWDLLEHLIIRTNANKRRELGQKGQKYIGKFYSPKVIASTYLDAIQAIPEKY